MKEQIQKMKDIILDLKSVKSLTNFTEDNNIDIYQILKEEHLLEFDILLKESVEILKLEKTNKIFKDDFKKIAILIQEMMEI